MYRTSTPRSKKGKRPLFVFVIVVLAIATIIGLALMLGRKDSANDVDSASKEQSTAAEQQASAPKPIDLQPTVDQWLATQSGDFGIVIYDPATRTTLATHQADKQYFTASIYKLYVVYLALMDIDGGKHSLGEAFRAGKTRQTCLYDAIHSSDSPCAEALLADIGNEKVNQRLADFGFTGTSFPAFMTTAQDAANILKRLQANRDLTKQSTDFLLDAMRNQIYRDAIPKGMPEATVANKIGFYETGWHDASLITMPDGRQFIMVVLTKDARSRQIADLARVVYAKLNTP